MKNRYLEILKASTKLGLTSFGGPAAHIGYFRDEYVDKRKWLDDKLYADIVALCQFLPGPASSQVGISIGLIRGGLLGGIISWIGFTMPSVILLMLFAAFISSSGSFDSGWIQGLKIVAVAVVAHALMGMQKSLAPDNIRITIAIGCAILALLFPTAVGQIAIILIAGIFGYFYFKNASIDSAPEMKLSFGKKTGLISWILFFVLLTLLPLLKPFVQSVYYTIFDTYYRVGSIVFGGGHVVLPMLQREVDVSADMFLTGYGAAQAVPGPLFTIAGFLGQITAGTGGALIAVFAMFLPSFLLVIGTLPFWSIIRSKEGIQAALKGVNAAVVGILLAALYDPVFTSAVNSPIDFVIVLITFTLLVVFKLAPYKVVLISVVLGAIVHSL
ncbi:chromate efflux transporter [Psychrobacillus psychrodurans]|uniref:chromate efflux transporter n=1 Tax=Psychrobacillus psychrodurans TaxID=126157 RepID=UPI0008EFC31F|nr:chromate efflux transporter [Psychrobacillus psychrodurans]MCZ8541918.1 chromate efflux transporter [Psychrobacillus psychrodurans]SFN14910.1 chromate transporter [Psychrobacillus psychrodurans]